MLHDIVPMTPGRSLRQGFLPALIAICALGASACDESLQGPGVLPGTVSSADIIALTPTQLAAQFGVLLDTPIRVRVLDERGRPVRSAVVKYSVLAGAGVFSADSTLTNDQGITEVLFRPLTTGTVIVEARVERPGGGTDQVQFTIRVLADPTVAADISRVSGNGQSQPVGSVLPEPLVVRVVNPDGFPVTEFPITFTLEDAQGELAGVSGSPDGPFGGQVTLSTDASGQARAFLRLGTEDGPHVVTASGVVGEGSARTTETLTFTATATASDRVAELVAISGQIQTVVIDTLHDPSSDEFQGRDPNPLVVQALDRFGNPVQVVTVSWFVADGGGNLASSATVTDANGLTQNVVAEVTEGRNVVVAFTPGADPVEFEITGEMLEPPEEENGEGGGGG